MGYHFDRAGTCHFNRLYYFLIPHDLGWVQYIAIQMNLRLFSTSYISVTGLPTIWGGGGLLVRQSHTKVLYRMPTGCHNWI